MYYAASKINHMSAITEKLRADALQARREHRLNDQKQILSEALSISRQSNDTTDLAGTLTALGQAQRDLGNNRAALAHYEEAVAIRRKLGNVLQLAHTIRHVADIQRHMGYTSAADANYREALALYRDNKHVPPLDLANAIRGHATLLQDAGDVAHAKSLWLEARDLYAVAGIKEAVKESSRRLALIA